MKSANFTEPVRADWSPEDGLRAIGFFALLAFPDRRDWRSRFVDDCVTVLWGEWADGRPERERQLTNKTKRRFKNKVALYDSGPITKALRRIPRRLLVADAAFALVFNSSWKSSRFPIRIKVNGIEVSNIGGITDVILRGVRKPEYLRAVVSPDTTKFHQRWWIPTKPVLHLAMALRAMLSAENAPNLASGSDMFGLFKAPQWVLPTIEQAKSLKRVLPLVPALKLKSEDLASLDWKIVQKVAID